MKVTMHTDYALRMLIFLAVHEDKPVKVSDVAEAYRLSRNHLLKVALTLGKLGYVKTARGRSGGISLGRPATEINLGAVLRAMETDFALVDCMKAGGPGCAIAPACRLKGVFAQALHAFLAVFDGYTLAEITKDRTVLTILLNERQTREGTADGHSLAGLIGGEP